MTNKFRFSISLQMYVIIGVFVALILIASLLGRISLSQMNDIQKNITEQQIPGLSIAIKMGQESVSLANVAPKFLTVTSQLEVQEVRTLIDAHSERLDEVIQQLSDVTFETNRDILKKFQELSEDLLKNLKLLEKSVFSTVDIKNIVKAKVESATGEARVMNNFLAARIDDQTFFLSSGWRTLRQKRAVGPAQRLRNDAINYYRSLLSLRVQSQAAANLLNETVQFSNLDLLQPLRERFQAALDNCARLITRIPDEAFRESIHNRYKAIEHIGLGEGDQTSEDAGLFDLMEKVLKEEQQQRAYLASNADIVEELSTQTDQLIEGIQRASSNTSSLFAEAIDNRRGQFFALNIISVILAILVAHFLVRKNLISRIKSLSRTMITLSEGNLRTPLLVRGNDEITDMGRSLDVFRRHAYEAQKLELAEKLAKEVKEKNSELESAIVKLKKAQQQMIMQEKLASLGQLTSGIAHEIKNPLNFITNFSLISKDLLEDISREVTEVGESIPADNKSFIEEVLRDLYGNMEKINFHGQRANDIVKGMLQHSRGGASGELEEINLNRFLDSTINLAYQGKRSSNKKFNVDIHKSYDQSIDKVKINPQDISRVILNLVTNACDATEEKAVKLAEKDQQFSPQIWINTTMLGDQDKTLEIRVKDNGPGIPDDLAQKVFDPFFTTKPTDKGTGLGLSLSHDIVAKHQGVLKLNRLDEGTEFIIELPMSA